MKGLQNLLKIDEISTLQFMNKSIIDRLINNLELWLLK